MSEAIPHDTVRRVRTDDGELTLLPDQPIRGGEAMVYRAVADDGACLALKVSVYPGSAGDWLREERERVIALTRTEAAPWLVPVLASGEWSGRPFLVMPWMPRTLEAFVAAGPSGGERRAVCEALCEALVAIQRADPSFVHRDLKPSNVFLDDRGRVRLGDLGAARTRITGATTTTAALYTPGFAPPEQAFPGRHRPDPAWDAFALAATVWCVLVGERLRAPAHNAKCLTPLGHRVLAGRAEGAAAECLDTAAMLDLLPEDRAAWDREVGDPRLLRALRAMLAPDPRRRTGTPSDLRRAFAPAPRRGPFALAALGLGALAALAAAASGPGSAPSGPAYDVVRIPAGVYVFGAVERGPWRRPWDLPATDYHLERDVLFGKTEVSQRLWQELTGDSSPADDRQIGARDEWCGAIGAQSLIGPDLPVHCVTFAEALRFANAMSEAWGLAPAYVFGPGGPDDVRWDPDAPGWRLPTAQEWEAAARFGRAVDHEGDDPELGCAWGNIADQSHERELAAGPISAARCDDGFPALAPVGSLEPTPSGAYDLGGNASELVWDDHAPGHRGARGASFGVVPKAARYSGRGLPGRDEKSRGLGVRLARNAP
jgi:sulfatase modifying factor 1